MIKKYTPEGMPKIQENTLVQHLREFSIEQVQDRLDMKFKNLQDRLET